MMEKVIVLCILATAVCGGGVPGDRHAHPGYVNGRYGYGGYPGGYYPGSYGSGGYRGPYGPYRDGLYGPGPAKTAAEIAAKTGRLPADVPVGPAGAPIVPPPPPPPGKTPEEIELKTGRRPVVPAALPGPVAPGTLPAPGPAGPADAARGPGYPYRGPDGYRPGYGYGYNGRGYYGDPVGPPQPYNTAYDVATHDGGQFSQTEQGNDLGFKTGSYTIRTAEGLYRVVDYVADDAGFRATIRTNEPGTDNKNPADVNIIAEVSPVNYPPGGYYGGYTPYGPGGRYAGPGGRYVGPGGQYAGPYDAPGAPGAKPVAPGYYDRYGPPGSPGYHHGADGRYGSFGPYGPGYAGKPYKKSG